MYEIIYSPVVQEKLSALKSKLIEMCDENVGIKHFLYYIEGDKVYVTEMYDEREDFTRALYYFIASLETAKMKGDQEICEDRQRKVVEKIEPDCRERVRAQLERMKELCKERNNLYMDILYLEQQIWIV